MRTRQHAIDARIGVCITEARLRAGLSRERLARKLGMSAGQITNWEKGHSEPGATRLYEVLTATGATLVIDGQRQRLALKNGSD
jgi:transcriptional regulator with XRE-family HTH domain